MTNERMQLRALIESCLSQAQVFALEEEAGKKRKQVSTRGSATFDSGRAKATASKTHDADFSSNLAANQANLAFRKD